MRRRDPAMNHALQDGAMRCLYAYDTSDAGLCVLFGAFLFYSIAVSFDLYQRAMMDEAIDGGGGEGIVVVEDVSPISESAVGGYDDGTTFIPVRDDLEQQLSALLVDGEIA